MKKICWLEKCFKRAKNMMHHELLSLLTIEEAIKVGMLSKSFTNLVERDFQSVLQENHEWEMILF